ncbi:HAMP domain-containing sensor histidine kinase [Streptomyces hirsutus]
MIEVADNGPGIKPDEAPHVFDRFYRATPLDPATGSDGEAGPEPGSGLGLAIAAAIAAAHGGRLELDNHHGEGLHLPSASARFHDCAEGRHR